MTGLHNLVKATVSAHALIVNQRQELLLGQLNYKDHRRSKWSFPGGFVDVEESLEQALCREVVEEIGITLLEWQQVAVEPLLTAPPRPHIGFLFLCTAWEGEPERLSRELMSIRWIDQERYRSLHADEQLAYPWMGRQVACLGWNL